MPRAGFYAIHNTRIRFGRDGVWYADDEPIAYPRIADLFSRSIRRGAEGGYILDNGYERAAVEVDDTPFVVTGVAFADDGSAFVELNDHTKEKLDPSTLLVGERDVLYCAVKGGSERARFLRPAYYQIASRVAEEPRGRFVLHLGETRHRIGQL
jgi:hypothetical protein